MCPAVNSDVIIVGAGATGLFLAADLASLGYGVRVLEARDAIGGVWALNDYPGLRLHGYGASYRCFSHAPAWTRTHDPRELHRPARREILDYLGELASVPGVLVETGRRVVGHEHLGDRVAVRVGARETLHARALVYCVGFMRSICGTPPHRLCPVKWCTSSSEVMQHRAVLLSRPEPSAPPSTRG